MIFSLGFILIGGFLIGCLFSKIKLPGLVGMLLFGLVIGPYCLNLIDGSVLAISAELRQIALVIILTRSGLNLDFKSLRKIGRPAVLMCFVPATFEIIGVTFAGYFLLRLSLFESMLLGAVLGAVSPAVVSPRMLSLIEQGYGEEHGVPKLVLAGSSMDDIYVVVLFYSFLGLVQNNVLDMTGILMIPVSVILGILLGATAGTVLHWCFKRWDTSRPVAVLLTLSVSFLCIGLENMLKQWVSVSALLAIMVMSMLLLFKNEKKARELSESYTSLWKFFEILLFVLVGATVDLFFAVSNGLMALLVHVIGLLFRTAGVYVSLIATPLKAKERLFVILAYLPKATVQASIGGIALSMGLACGSVVLTVSVLSILITAPLGAILIDSLKYRLLTKRTEPAPLEEIPSD